MKCVDCGGNFYEGEANAIDGQWACIVCEASRPAVAKVEAVKVEAKPRKCAAHIGPRLKNSLRCAVKWDWTRKTKPPVAPLWECCWAVASKRAPI